VDKGKGFEHLRDQLSGDVVSVDGIALASNTTVKNLGVIFDQDLSFNKSQGLHFFIYVTFKKSDILSQKDAEKLVHAFLDYCNSLLSGFSNKFLESLQLIRNSAVCVITKTKKRDQITPVLAALHWLPVKSRITFEILLLTDKAFIGDAPLYLKELVVPYCPTRELRSLNVRLAIGVFF